MIVAYTLLAGFWHCFTLSSSQNQSSTPTPGMPGVIRGRADNTLNQTCQTPSHQKGKCTPLRQCQVLWREKNWSLIRRSVCSLEGEAPRVCCPITDRDSESVNVTTPQSSTISQRPLRAEAIWSNSSSPSQLSSTTRSSISTTPARASRRQNHNLFPSDCGRSTAPFRRIIGGQEAAIGSWPWMAVLYLVRRGLKSAECGGVLVTSKHVITAAHCTVNSRRGTAIKPSNLLIRLADHDLDSEDDGTEPIDITVKSVVKHENFNLRNFQNDIAILELTLEVDFRNDLMPICLPFDAFQSEDLSQRNAFAAGWGTISFGGPASPKLQEVQLRIWDNPNCEEVFRKDVPITNVNLCAGDGDKDACRGDSGGPLMLANSNSRFYLIGIVSFGRKCAEPGVPGVYTRVSSFLSWIEDHVDHAT